MKQDLLTGLILLYIVICMAVTAFAKETGLITYGQLSLLYLPMFVLFMICLKKRSRDSASHSTKAGIAAGMFLCSFIIVSTLAFTAAGLLA